MKYVKESGFGELLPHVLQQDKLYVGVSAGSVIMGPDISLASWIPNDEDVNNGYVSDTKGLEIVPFAIWPHFQQAQMTLLRQKAKESNYSTIALTNTQAVLWQDNHYKIVGGGKELIFTQ
jgi:peptidase E